jgi:precorrin-2 dehydrogenase/sirohydrochlorin ferrochelatase
MESQNNLFPIFLKLSNMRVLIVGGGNVAAEKLHFLLKSSPNANVTVVTKVASEKVLNIIKSNKNIRLIIDDYKKSHLTGIDIVIAATEVESTNLLIWDDSKSKQILVNVADTPELCDFYMGSIVTKGDLKLAISTNGKSPTFAKRFRQVLEAILPDTLPDTLNNLHSIRKTLKGDFAEKVDSLNKLTEILTLNQNENELFKR